MGKDHQAYIEWRLLEKRHPRFFKMHEKLPRDKIVRELAQYDFGVVNGFNYATGENEIPNLFSTTMATKMFAFSSVSILSDRSFELFAKLSTSNRDTNEFFQRRQQSIKRN